MNTNVKHANGDSMKKTMIIVALAAVLVFAFASSAYANGWINWTTAVASGGQTGSPHSGYTTTSTKCEVCHAVHGANPDMKLMWGGSGQPVAGATNSCAYCHQTISGGYTQVYYDANTSAITWAAYSNQANYGNEGHGIDCTQCHSVHGAGLVTGGGTVAGLGTSYYGKYNLKAAATANAPAAFRTGTVAAQQQTYFCSQCHNYYSRDTAATTLAHYNTIWDITAGGSTAPIAAPSATQASHPMVSVGTYDYTTTGGRGGNVAAGTQIAWVGSTQCRSCHDAGVDSTTGYVTGAGRALGASFPHYTAGYDGFLEAAANNAATAETFAYATAGASGTPAINARDGACLKCHASTTSGVSMGY